MLTIINDDNIIRITNIGFRFIIKRESVIERVKNFLKWKIK